MMKKFTQKLCAVAAFVLCGISAQAQIFIQETGYVDYLNYGDTIHLDINSPIGLPYGVATIKIWYEGDYGANSEFISLYGEDNALIGKTHPYFDGSDCMADSATFTFPASLINSWNADNTLKFYGLASDNVDFFCSSSHVKISLTYNYCLVGPIAALHLAQTAFCSIDNPVNVTAIPAGGTFTGTNINATNFNPQGLLPGAYALTYTFTNAGGCTSYDSLNVTIKEPSFASSDKDTVCALETATLSAVGTGHTKWFTNISLINPIGIGNTFVTPPLSNTTSFYFATLYTENYFKINDWSTHDSVLVDIDAMAGDDRGGIAVTNDYVYIVGDNNTARYDLDLQNGTSLPRMDGLFSDLGNGQLYTIYNPIIGIPDANAIDSLIYITEIRTLNDDLTLGTGTIALSDSIAFGWDINQYQSGIFAGNGFLIVYSAPRSSFYAIDLQDGIVTELGNPSADFVGAYSETWASWGVAEFTSNGYSVIYRDDNSSTAIYRYNITTETKTTLASFVDLSDMASFTYAPWNNRWYFHVEGGSDFDPDYNFDEILGYANASDSTGTSLDVVSSACPAKVTVVVDKPTVSLTGGGNICSGDAPVTVFGTPADGVYAGTGVTGSSFNPSIAGVGIHTITYTITNAAGCSNTDTVTYVVNCTLAIDENLVQNIRMYPNPANESMFVELGDVNSTTTLKVFDAAGRLIINQNNNGASTVKMDVSGLQVGTYILQISGDVNTRKVFIIAR